MAFEKYLITSASVFSVIFLTDHRIGTVHSVYRKTINLSINGQLFALQAKGSPLSPISLITELTPEDMDRLQIVPGTPVKIQGSMIQLGKQISFQLAQERVPDLKLSGPLNQESLIQMERECLHALYGRRAGSFELLFSSEEQLGEIEFLVIAAQRLTDTQHFLEQKQWTHAAKTLRRLIGLGLGLTPGGDDFLCGVLAGLIFCGLKDHPFTLTLTEQILEHLCDTNDISAAFLRCALIGQFSLAVNNLPNMKSGREILDRFCEIGHSSGTDTLCGIYYILKHRNLF